MQTNNLWLPYAETLTLPARPPAKGRVLVIIPTAGKSSQRLSRCLHATRKAALGIESRIVVVHCPATDQTRPKVEKACRGIAEVVSLEGPFNFCHSINVGIGQATPADHWAVFLNDDAFFREEGDLARLVDAMVANRWSTIGPWIESFHGETLGATRGSGSIRTNQPVNGACTVWDMNWLYRLGPLDEAFGIGWGLDEPDMCLRALRLGARFGRLDSVAIDHLRHATFGDDYTQYHGAAHQHNLTLFRTKYGPEVHGWGKSHHWHPLPGVRVSIAAHNAEKWLQGCLDSVEQALEGFRWVLLIGDDASTDDTLKIAETHATRLSRADRCVVRHFPDKAITVDQAKNRVIRMGEEFREAYPAMCLMDADDQMGLDRVRHLLWRARDGGLPAVMGDHMRHAPHWHLEHLKVYRASPNSQLEGGFGPWATLFHASLIPRNHKLFRENPNQKSHGDVDLWVRWLRDGIRITPFPGAIVHHYHLHLGTISRPFDRELQLKERARWKRRKAQLLAAARKENGSGGGKPAK